MSNPLFHLEHAAYRFAAACGRQVIEFWSGFSDREAGDFLDESDLAPTTRSRRSTPEYELRLSAERAAVAAAEMAAHLHEYLDSPAAVDQPRDEPAAGLTWQQWIEPAISDVLANHKFVDIMTEDRPDWQRYGCYHAGEDRTHQWLDDAQAWRDHVSPLIAERIAKASKSFKQ